MSCPNEPADLGADLITKVLHDINNYRLVPEVVSEVSWDVQDEIIQNMPLHLADIQRHVCDRFIEVLRETLRKEPDGPPE